MDVQYYALLFALAKPQDSWQAYHIWLCRLCAAQLPGMPFALQSIELLSVQPAHLCVAAQRV